MGPFLSVDKSFIQSLSEDEIDFLDRHFSVIIAPILVQEIAANLRKYPNDDNLSKRKVSLLAKKVKGFDAKTTCRYEIIYVNDLLGARVSLRPQIPRVGGREFLGEDGSRGIIFGESPEDLILRRWTEMDFNEGDLRAAENHLELANYDLEASRKLMAALYPRNAKYRSLDELASSIDYMLANFDHQWDLIESSMTILKLPSPERVRIRVRWEAENRPPFKKFSAYAFFCYRLGSIYWVGITSGIIPTSRHKKTMVDHQYLFYLPFCHAFCSGDNFHREFCSYFLRRDQDFVWGGELKRDLQIISSFYKGMTNEEKKYYEKNLGHYPPPIPDSITNILWQKHMRPWTPGSGNLVVDMSEEKKKKLTDHINRIIKSFEKDAKN